MEKDYMNNMAELNLIFKKINKYGYIKSNLKGSGGAGNMFEKLIGKRQDSTPLPDYKNIEIKTHISTTSYPISLLSIMPNTDKPNSYDMLQNFLRACGHYGIKNKSIKYFNDKININEIKYHHNYFIKSYIDSKNDAIVMAFLSYDLVLIEKMIWPLKDIYHKFKNKLNYLALIDVNKKTCHENVYYKYNKIHFYKFKGKQNLINALNNKKIYISFNIELKQELKKDKVRYHGITFDIQKVNINSLYEIIDFNCP